MDIDYDEIFDRNSSVLEGVKLSVMGKNQVKQCMFEAVQDAITIERTETRKILKQIIDVFCEEYKFDSSEKGGTIASAIQYLEKISD